MAYDITTGILTVDPENETFDTMLDNIAIAIKDYRVTEVSGVLARDLGMLCTSPNVNKWSKHKPIRYNTISKLIDEQFKLANYGIEFPFFLLSGIWSSSKENRVPIYLAPRGIKKGDMTYDEWFRITDFDKYNSKAQPYEIYLRLYQPYTGQNITAQLVVYNSDNQDLTLADFSMKPTGDASAVSKPLSEYYLAALWRVDNAYYIYNTKKTLLANIGLPTEMKFTNSYAVKKGVTVDIMCCLMYDTSIPEGFSQLNIFEGDYARTRFIPLNMTAKMEGEKSATVIDFPYFTSFTINMGDVQPPITGKNYYSFGSYFVLVGGEPYQLKNTFRLRFYIKRGSTIIEPSNQSNLIEYTITFSENIGKHYYYDLGEVTLSPITTTQSGDELWLTTYVLGANSTWIEVYNKKIYTH